MFTFIHSPATQDTKLIKSDTAVLDIYFRREELLGDHIPARRTVSTNEISDGEYCFPKHWEIELKKCNHNWQLIMVKVVFGLEEALMIGIKSQLK